MLVEAVRRFCEEMNPRDSDTHESRVSPYLVTRDPSLKPTGAVTNTMDKDGLLV